MDKVNPSSSSVGDIRIVHLRGLEGGHDVNRITRPQWGSGCASLITRSSGMRAVLARSCSAFAMGQLLTEAVARIQLVKETVKRTIHALSSDLNGFDQIDQMLVLFSCPVSAAA
jgi:hypothetical protein